MRNKIILFLATFLGCGVANSKEEALKFQSEYECRNIYTKAYEYGANSINELTDMSVEGVKNSTFRYLAGRDSTVLDLKNSFGETQFYKALDGVKKKLDHDQLKYISANIDYSESILSERKKDFLGKNPGLSSVSRDFALCVAASVYKNKKVDVSSYESYAKFSPKKGRFGNFDISVDSCSVGPSVGVKNRYSEPDKWEGSQFVVLDARFKNVDKEGRLPFEGSLIIKTPNGDELRYDNTETIMQEGYGIYFKSVNPLVTLPTKIVYRIPTDIEGEILWEPGRNDEGKRLWCAFVNSKN